MERCIFCQEELTPGTRLCPHCGRELPESTPNLTLPLTEPAATETKRCPRCGEELPAEARFCGRCALPLALLEEERDEERGGIILLPFLSEGEAPASAAATAQTATSSVPGASAATQSGAPVVSSAPAGPQSGAPAGPTAPGGVSPVPGAPRGPQAGSPGSGSSSLQVASKGAAHGLRAKMFGTVMGKVATIILAATVVAAATGIVVYALTQPQPVLTVTGEKQVQGDPAGGVETVFHVTGQKFSANATVTFLLDGKQAPGTPTVKSDKNGNLKASLTVTDDWLLGKHTLTARDSQGHVTRQGVVLIIIIQPVIIVESTYQAGSTPAGTTSTVFHVSGQGFAYNSTITFLLDGAAAPGSQPAQSNAKGDVEADLTVTGDWTQGAHTLTARDAQGDTAQSGVALAIVAPGKAGTPGPQGAPSDSANFTILITANYTDTTSGQHLTGQIALSFSGGTVSCPSYANGQPFTSSNAGNIVTRTITCTGTYQGGKLTYLETTKTWVSRLSDGLTCHTNGPFISTRYSGSFTSATQGSGRYSADSAPLSCNTGFGGVDGATGTWTGTIVG